MERQIGSDAIYTAITPTLNYRVMLGSTTIYRGRAIAAPSGIISVNVSEIVYDYLESEEFPQRNVNPILYEEENGYIRVYLYRINNDESTRLLGEYSFLRSYDEDWAAGVYDSREEVWTGQSITMSNPINGRLDPRMQQLYTVYRRTTGETITWGIVPKIRVIPSKIVADPDGGTYTVTIISNVHFTASTQDGWVSISGSGDTYTVTVQPNSGDDRNGQITLSYLDEADNPATTIIPVEQAALDIRIIPESINFGVDGGESRFTVFSNVDAEPVSSADWLTFVPIRWGEGWTTYKLVADPNRESTSARTATISVRNAVLYINQEAFAINVNIDTTEYGWNEGTGTLIVTANGHYTVTTDESWLRVSPNEGSSGTTRFTVTVDENDTLSARTAHIIIEDVVITITQARQTYIAITPMSWTAAATGDSREFQISDRFEHGWKITGNGRFVVSEAEGTGNTTITMSIGQAQSTSQYSPNVKFIDMTTGEEISLTIKQAAPVINVTPSTINALASGGTYSFTVYSEIDYPLSTDADWITLSATGGTSGTTEYTFTVNPNATMSEKTGHIKIFGSSRVTVIQEASQIAVSPTSVNAYALGSGYTISVTSNTLYNVTTDADWITPVPSTGSTGVTQFILNVDDNQVPSARTAVVYVEYIPITVWQEALSITLSSSSGATYPDSPSRTVLSITSNGRYTITCDEDWVSVDTLTGTSGTTIITISTTGANKTTGLRPADINIGYQTFWLCQPSGINYIKPLTFTVTSGGTITWTAKHSGSETGYVYKTIYYSKNGGDWKSLTSTSSGNAIDVVSGDVLTFKAIYNGTQQNLYLWNEFGGTAKVQIGGNILSMAYLDNFAGARVVPAQQYWIGLFRGLTYTTYGLVLPSNLPSSEQDNYKYLNGPSSPISHRAVNYTPTVQDADDYLTFEITEGGTLTWGSSYFAYSLNGASWVRPKTTRSVSVSAGDKVRFKAGWEDGGDNVRIESLYGFVGSTASFNLSGNVASLIYYTAFANEHPIYTYNNSKRTFSELFAGTNVVDASRLKVPQIFVYDEYLSNMFDGCSRLTAMPDLSIAERIPTGNYYSMFYNCTSLTVADKLPTLNEASNVGNAPLESMFDGCSSLSRVKDISLLTSESIHNEWMAGVSSAGTFEKRTTASGWSRNQNGIPYGWTITNVNVPATVEPRILSFNYSGGTGVLNISDADNTGWEITGTTEWIAVSQYSGVGNATVTVSVSGNTEATYRAHYIKIVSGDKSPSVEIYQDAVPVAEISPTTVIFSAAGETAQLSVTDTAGLGWVISGTPEWITVSQSAGTGNATVSFTAGNNEDGSDRNATLSFTSFGVTTEISTQQGSGYAGEYLTLEILSAGSIYTITEIGNAKQYYYSKNGGEWTANQTNWTYSVVEGDVLKFKASLNNLDSFFKNSTARFNVKGNLLSMVYGDDFASHTAVTQNDSFKEMFRVANVANANKLVLAAVPDAQSEGCYSGMFRGCNALLSAPEILSTTASFNSYDYMFSGCTQLNYIKCLFDWYNIGATDYWVSGVAANGTFVKKAGSSWPTGTSGIPSGWTVQEE